MGLWFSNTGQRVKSSGNKVPESDYPYSLIPFLNCEGVIYVTTESKCYSTRLLCASIHPRASTGGRYRVEVWVHRRNSWHPASRRWVQIAHGF